jgi:hypothetical protein
MLRCPLLHPMAPHAPFSSVSPITYVSEGPPLQNIPVLLPALPIFFFSSFKSSFLQYRYSINTGPCHEPRAVCVWVIVTPFSPFIRSLLRLLFVKKLIQVAESYLTNDLSCSCRNQLTQLRVYICTGDSVGLHKLTYARRSAIINCYSNGTKTLLMLYKILEILFLNCFCQRLW